METVASFVPTSSFRGLPGFTQGRWLSFPWVMPADVPWSSSRRWRRGCTVPPHGFPKCFSQRGEGRAPVLAALRSQPSRAQRPLTAIPTHPVRDGHGVVAPQIQGVFLRDTCVGLSFFFLCFFDWFFFFWLFLTDSWILIHPEQESSLTHTYSASTAGRGPQNGGT